MKPQFEPLTDDERERMAEDFSDTAVLRMAEGMRARDPEHEIEAVKRADQYRSGYPASTPGAAFWSRVIVELLAPRREAPTPQEARADVLRVMQDAPEGAIADISACKLEPRRATSTAYPSSRKPPKNDNPDQGSLF